MRRWCLGRCSMGLESFAHIVLLSWFAYISPSEPCLLEDVLVNPKHALTRQVFEHYLPGLIAHDPTNINAGDRLVKARNSLFNVDGLGVAWYTSSNADFERGNTGESADGTQKQGLRPAMYKTVTPPLQDLNFKSICANTESRVVFAHIRAASGTPIVNVNNHPFIFGRHTFMHNGVVSDFTAIRRQMCNRMSDAAFAGINGSTDSEHIGALYLTYMTDNGGPESFEVEYSAKKMAESLRRVIATVIELQLQMLGAKARPNSLNLCVTDGVKLVAYRFRNHATEEPPSLYWSTRAGTTLNRKYQDHPDGNEAPESLRSFGISPESHGKHLIVASEPSTYKDADWHLIGKNQCLLATPDSKFDVTDVPYPREWNVVDPDTAELHH
nr:putative glutamine amidotransferase dug3 [Quercus suber]POE87645.1 putative glutamine amidotransferase dug3 [Quercus suber]